MGVLVIIGLAAVVGYLVSLRVHPLTKCPACKMTGRHFGSVYTSSYRRCRKCGGTGRQDRMGVRLFYGGTNNTGVFPKKLLGIAAAGEGRGMVTAVRGVRRSGAAGYADVSVPA
jgi:hypothetical protein